MGEKTIHYYLHFLQAVQEHHELFQRHLPLLEPLGLADDCSTCGCTLWRIHGVFDGDICFHCSLFFTRTANNPSGHMLQNRLALDVGGFVLLLCVSVDFYCVAWVCVVCRL